MPFLLLFEFFGVLIKTVNFWKPFYSTNYLKMAFCFQGYIKIARIKSWLLVLRNYLITEDFLKLVRLNIVQHSTMGNWYSSGFFRDNDCNAVSDLGDA